MEVYIFCRNDYVISSVFCSAYDEYRNIDDVHSGMLFASMLLVYVVRI